MYRFCSVLIAVLLCCVLPLQAEAQNPKIDLKNRDMDRPVFVLVYGKLDDCKAMKAQLLKLAGIYDIQVESYRLEEIDEEAFKLDVLVPISVFQQIQIAQSKNAKQLYPHLLVYINGKPVTYWPQVRRKAKPTSIDTFLEKALDDEVVGLEKIGAVQKCLKKR